MEEFGCSQIAATAATSMFLIGMGVGAMPMAPLSECKCALFIKRSSRTSCIAEWWRTLSTLNGCMLLFKIDATEGCFSWRHEGLHRREVYLIYVAYYSFVLSTAIVW